jgi:hypothetical protein
MPDLSAHGGDGIAEGAVRLGVPSGGGGSEWLVGCEVMRPEGDERVETKQRRGGAQNGEVGPLTLSFDAEMGARVLEGDLKLPAGDEPLEDIDGSGVRSVQRKAWGRLSHLSVWPQRTICIRACGRRLTPTVYSYLYGHWFGGYFVMPSFSHAAVIVHHQYKVETGGRRVCRSDR